MQDVGPPVSRMPHHNAIRYGSFSTCHGRSPASTHNRCRNRGCYTENAPLDMPIDQCTLRGTIVYGYYSPEAQLLARATATPPSSKK